MVRMVSIFVMVWCSIYMGYTVFREMTGRERWTLLRGLSLALLTAIVALAILFFVVTLF